MKMRKILSFVLVLSLVLGSFSMAFAATPATSLSDIAGIANEEAIQVNNDLGIINGFPDGTFLPEKAVTRAEFAAMITRALAIPESALAGYSTTSFKDTTGYGWAVPYLAFAQSKGIMIGDGMGNVMPGRTINVNEAMTMVLRAVGYVNNSSALVGTWPANYVTVAQNVGLYDDVAAAFSVDRANAAQIIYNALTVQKVAVDADGATSYLTFKVGEDEYATTLLNAGLDCMYTEEVVEYDADSLINLGKYIGANANVYRNDGGDGDIVAVEMLSKFLTGEYDGDGTFEADNGTDYNVSDAIEETDVAYFENARSDSNTSLAAITDTSITVAVDFSGKTIKEIYSIGEWVVDDAVMASEGDIEDLEDQEFATHDFATDDNDEIDLNSFELVGVDSLDKIAEDDVVYIYTDGDYITKLAVGTAVVEDVKVTEQDGDEYTIGGKVYKEATTGFEDIEAFDVGDTVNISLDAFGKIFKLEVAVGTPDLYAVVKKYATDDGWDDAKVSLYTSDDATKTIFIDDDADKTGVITEDAIISYGLDSDGVIDAYDATIVTAAAATLTSVTVLAADDETYAVSKDVVVFTVNDDGDYDIMSIKDVENDVDLAGTEAAVQLILNDDDYVVAMLIDADVAGDASDENYAVINASVFALDADDEKIQKLTGFMDGAAFTKYTDDSATITNNFDEIEIWNFTIDANGVITDGTTLAAADTSGSAIAELNADKTAVNVGGTWYAIADDSTVYVAKLTDGEYEYTVSALSSLRADYTISLFDTDTDDAEYDLIVFVK